MKPGRYKQGAVYSCLHHAATWISRYPAITAARRKPAYVIMRSSTAAPGKKRMVAKAQQELAISCGFILSAAAPAVCTIG